MKASTLYSEPRERLGRRLPARTLHLLADVRRRAGGRGAVLGCFILKIRLDEGLPIQEDPHATLPSLISIPPINCQSCRSPWTFSSEHRLLHSRERTFQNLGNQTIADRRPPHPPWSNKHLWQA